MAHDASQPPACFRVHERDNVATLLHETQAGPVRCLGQVDDPAIDALEPIALGHKIALMDIAKGEAIIKYGVPIGDASQPIRRGQWVHLHNCASRLDERSAKLDLKTGVATDTPYV